VSIQLPDAASQQRTFDLVTDLNEVFGNEPGIESWQVLGGLSLLDGTTAPNAATTFIIFKDWSERTDPNLSQDAILNRLRGKFANDDRVKIKTLKLNRTDVFGTLQAQLGSVYVNDFNLFGRVYQVRVQADAPFRNRPEDIHLLKARNKDGKMVPLSTVMTVEKT